MNIEQMAKEAFNKYVPEAQMIEEQYYKRTGSIPNRHLLVEFDEQPFTKGFFAGLKANKEGLNGIVCECMTSCNCLENKIEKAEKWEALINSERIRVLGSGNLKGTHQHLSLELWDKYPGAFEASEPSRKVLTDYVDTIIKRAR